MCVRDSARLQLLTILPARAIAATFRTAGITLERRLETPRRTPIGNLVDPHCHVWFTLRRPIGDRLTRP
jgi:hypothetical protein